MGLPKNLSDYDISFNFGWIKDCYNIMDKIEQYQRIVDDEQQSKKKREVFAKEIENQRQYLEEVKNIVINFETDFGHLLYLKYVDGYSLAEVAFLLGYHENYVKRIHAKFANALKEKGLTI